jgi:transposase-like protein
VLTDDGPLRIVVPRDREGTFEPRLIVKHERPFTAFGDKILALYARGMTVREIQVFLAEMYAAEVSPDLISTVTDAVVAEVAAWQARPRAVSHSPHTHCPMVSGESKRAGTVGHRLTNKIPDTPASFLR